MVDAGHDVFFSKDRSYVCHRGTKSYTQIKRKSGIFVSEVSAKPYQTNERGHTDR